MCRHLICATSLALILMVVATSQAEVFVDDFNTPRDYLTEGTEGTIWDDFFGYLPGETVEALNASGDRDGQLYMSSDGLWDAPWNPLGPFLFKVVEGDFIAKVQITDYAGTPDEWVFHNDGGLMARAFLDDAGPGEDWISIDYFPIWNTGNFLWQCLDGVRNEGVTGCNNGKEWDSDTWLQLERAGNTFHVRTSPDGVNWEEISCSPKVRDDFDGLPLMVGLRHATYNPGVIGYVAFDHFSLEVIVRLKAFSPTPADGAGHISPTELTWQAGQYTAQHDVYFGTNFTDVNEATTATPDTYKGRQDAVSYALANLEPGTTYYWRIDEVNDAHPDKVWKGDVWSFTPIGLTASEPGPADEAECVLTNMDLTWVAGATARLHNIYFGTDESAVATASRTNQMGVYKGIKTTTSFDPGDLEPGTTYFWRIDEAENATVVYPGEVWRFTTLPLITVSDPNLVGWWKLDECMNNNIVVDSSGYNRHGTTIGGPVYIPGYDREALDMDGKNDYVDLSIGDLIGSLTNTTIMTWADFSNSGGAWQRIFDFGNDPNVYMFLTPRVFFIDPMRFAITTTGPGGEIQVDRPDTPVDGTLPSGWHNVAVTIDATTGTITLFLDGVEVASVSGNLVPMDLGNTTNNWLGRSQNEDDAFYLGALDDFRIYNKVLSATEMARAMGGDPYFAWNPQPPIGSIQDVESVPTLRWSPGLDATMHDVYFGMDMDGVSTADKSDTTGIYRGTFDVTSYDLADTLNINQTYYWRIDEQGTDANSLIQGKIWSFTTADYLVVDDMESYGGADTPGQPGGRIWYTWNDGYGWTMPDPGSHGNGTNSFADIATTPVNSGNQSLRMDYNNFNGFINIFGELGNASYAELHRTFDPPQDWTRRGSNVLSLWFFGDDNNGPETLYITLEDNLGKTGTVIYPDANAVDEPSWHEWRIDLNEFTNANVDLTNIQFMRLGIGEENTAQFGGIGVLFFDDARLYSE